MTNQDALNLSNANNLPDLMRQLPWGDMLAGMVPRRIARTGLSSSATHIEPDAGMISIVSIADNAALIMIEAGTAGAGEVKVTYSSAGVATLVFGDGAQTAYRVVKTVLPDGLVDFLAADSTVLGFPS